MLKQITMAAALAVLGTTVPSLAANNPIIPHSVTLTPMTHAKAAHVVARGAPIDMFMPSFFVRPNYMGTAEPSAQQPKVLQGLPQAKW